MKFDRTIALFFLLALFCKALGSEGAITASVADGNQAPAAEKKAEAPKPEEKKAEATAPTAEKKAEQPAEAPKPEEKKDSPAPAVEQKTEAPKPEEKKAEVVAPATEKKAEQPAEAPKPEEKKDSPAPAAEQKAEAPKPEEKKAEVAAPATEKKTEQPAAEAPKPEEKKEAALSAEDEDKALEKVIDEKVKPRILTPAVTVDEKTGPSAQLQEENKKTEAQPLKVDNQQVGQEKKTALVGEVKGVPSTLDTTRVDAGGNWVKKRAYWEKAEEIIEKISTANSAIHEQHIKFIKAQTEADDQLDKAFRELGFEQGQFADLVERLLEEIKQQQEKQGDLPEAKRQMEKTLKEKQRELEESKKALQDIDELEKKLEETIVKVHEQVQVCVGLGKKALDSFLAIGRELNDQKARLMYYEMDGFLATIEKNSTYISQELWNYFDSTAASIKQKIGEIGTKITEMRKKGTDLAKEFDRLEKEKLEKQQAEIKAEREKINKERADLEQQKQVPPPPPTLLTRVQEFFGSAWKYCVSWCAPVWDYTKNAAVQIGDRVQHYVTGGIAWVKQLFGFN